LHQTARNVAAHLAQANYAELHIPVLLI